jgi:predicted transglutaminase-like cysteine proteinase
LILLAVAGFALGTAEGVAAPLETALPSDASFTPIGSVARSPYGWLHFCGAQPAECKTAQLKPTHVQLTAQSWAELNQINAIVNRQVEPISDEDHYRIHEQDIFNWWTYPDDGKGNCNDYVLMKRKLLVEAGWPKAALLMTVVIDHEGGGHLILTVQTDRGDLILDNMRDEIVSWDQTGYRFLKRQSALNFNDWVSIEAQGDPRTATAGHPRWLLASVQLPAQVDKRVAAASEPSDAARSDHEKTLDPACVRGPRSRHLRHLGKLAPRDARLAANGHLHRRDEHRHRANPALAMAVTST